MNKTMRCRDCGVFFVFSEKDQAFYRDKHLNQPTRCKNCRGDRKERRGVPEYATRTAGNRGYPMP